MKKMYLLFYLTGIVCNSIHCTYAQTTPRDELNKRATIPIPSPDVAALSKFVHFPVKHINGQVDVSLPLYEIKLRNVSVPITLNYHTGGIRVNEEASLVGLGWALNAGGVIHHQINGVDDLSGYPKLYGQYFPFATPSENETYFTGVGSTARSGATIYNKNGALEDIVNKFYAPVLPINGDPDLYIYNMGNYCGKFMMWDNQSVDLSCNNVLFRQYTGSTIYSDSIIATTPEGNIYRFKNRERSVAVTGLTGDAESTRSKTTAYYLSEIATPNGESIKFHYETFANIAGYNSWGGQYPGYGENYKYGGYPLLPSLAEDYSLDTYQGQNSNSSYTRLRSYTFTSALYLQKIEFPNGEVEFIHSPRQDMYGVKLDKIRVKNSQGERIKTYIFDYSYFEGTAPGHGQDVLTATNVSASFSIDYPVDFAKKRLKLLSFSEVDNVNESNPVTTKFTYNESTRLPYKTSFSQDFWGYYNGNSNTTLLPSYTRYGSALGIPGGMSQYATANRDVNETMAQAGILTGVSHPTFSKSFQFESNDCINSFITSTETDRINHAATNIGSGVTETVFTLNSRQTVTISVMLMKQNSAVSAGDIIGLPNCLYAYIEKKSASSDIWNRMSQYAWGGSNLSYVNNVFQKTLVGEVLEAGTYRLTANFPDNHASLGVLGSNMANIAVAYDVITPTNKSLVGGLRIKELATTGYPMQYIYQNGILATAPSFVYSYTYPTVDSYGAVRDMTKTHLTTHPIHPYSFSANGGLVGYRNITEKHAIGDLGRIEYEYNMRADVSGIGGPSWLPGIHPVSDLSNGSLNNKYIYDKDGTLVYRKSYNHTLINPKLYWGFKVTPGINYLSGGLTNSHTVLSRHMKTYFYPIVQGKLATSYKYWEYCAERTSPYGNSISYVYNDQGLVKTKTTYANMANKLVEEYTYPPDHTQESSVYSLMVSKNILSPVIEVKRDQGGSTSREKTNYTQPYTNIFVPSTIQFQKSSHETESRIAFERYDNYGNPVSINKDGLGSIIYLWSYKGQYPVAEIKYSDYATVNTALATVGLGSIEILAKDPNPDKAKLDKLRDIATLNHTHITTYRYSPLKGMVEETSPAKITTYYTYDSFNRLKETYYFENNDLTKKRIIQSHEYNFSH